MSRRIKHAIVAKFVSETNCNKADVNCENGAIYRDVCKNQKTILNLNF